MKPSIHAIASFFLGMAIWFFTKSIYAALLCFVSGTFVDFDHVIEYVVHFGRKGLSIKEIYRVCNERLFEKLYVVFHSAELAILLCVLGVYTKNIYLLAISAGYTSHLILDFIGNPLHLFSYFLLRRFMRKFKAERLVKKGYSYNARKN